MIGSVLIANRGEIAMRVARTCRELGLRTVAVYSTADRDSAVVRFADEAVHIGPPPVKQSYLNVPAIIEAARLTGVDAIHPGYGFLSEDPDFAEVCEAEGFVFVGPRASVIAALGDKARARRMMAEAGLPVLPGSENAVDSTDARDLAHAIGFPVILKACAGGGGRGLSVIRNAAGFTQAYRDARATAAAVFGDGRVYLERYVDNARHIEVQVLADQSGSVVHFPERDCSVQRRHQKLIEETPAPTLPDGLPALMAQAAVDGARGTGYTGLGTLEFLVDEDSRFYFMEINCRIQVEHPVTEMITGIDFVAEQLSIAAGAPLRVRQEDVRASGVAIECRLNAEDPRLNFAPAPGTLTTFTPPGGGFVRVDTHACAGYVVPREYDSLLAKVVTWGADRDQALARMNRALTEFHVGGNGVRTTKEFLLEVLSHPAYRSGEHTTALIPEILRQSNRPPVMTGA